MNVISFAGTKSVTGVLIRYPSLPVGGTFNGAYYCPQDLVLLHMREMGFQRFIYTDELIKRRTGQFDIAAKNFDVRDPATLPRRLPHSYSIDTERYGNSITQFLHVVRPAKLGDFLNEHGVVHTSVIGNALYSSGLSSSFLSPGPEWDLGWGALPGLKYDDSTGPVKRPNIRLDITGDSPRLIPNGSATLRAIPLGMFSECIGSLMNFLSEGPIERYIGPQWYVYQYTTKATDSVSVKYGVEVWSSPTIPYPVGNDYYHEVFDMSVEYVTGTYGPVTANFAVGNYNVVGPTGSGVRMTTKHLFSERRIGGVWVSNSTYPDGTRLYDGSDRIFHISVPPSRETPVIISSLGLSPYNSDRIIPVDVHNFMASSINESPIAVAFENRIARYVDDIRTIAPLSSGEGLSKLLEIIEANHLETLLEIRDIAALIKPAAIARRWYEYIRLERVPTISQFLDDLTALALIENFVKDPLVGSVSEWTTKIDRVRKRFTEDGIPLQIAHGKPVKRTIDLGEPFTSVRLTARSKLVGSLGSQSILANMLGVKAAGLFPSLSNFWDVVPLSFVVDWFSNLDDRIEELDNQLYAMCFDWCYCTHSFTLEWTVPPDILRDYNMEPNPEVVLRYYRREPSRYYPSLRDSVFDWNVPPAPKNWGVIGSTFYQLLRE